MEVIRRIEIEADADRLWDVLDGQFGDISQWAARMLESRAVSELGALGGREVTTVEYGPATETLYRRHAGERMLGYWVEGPSLPPPIAGVQTEWRVSALDGGSSEVAIRFVAFVADAAMQPMLEERLEAGMVPLLEELKYYAETGEPHANNHAGAGAVG